MSVSCGLGEWGWALCSGTESVALGEVGFAGDGPGKGTPGVAAPHCVLQATRQLSKETSELGGLPLPYCQLLGLPRSSHF